MGKSPFAYCFGAFIGGGLRVPRRFNKPPVNAYFPVTVMATEAVSTPGVQPPREAPLEFQAPFAVWEVESKAMFFVLTETV